jgi:hypothetical protein
MTEDNLLRSGFRSCGMEAQSARPREGGDQDRPHDDRFDRQGPGNRPGKAVRR